MMISKPLSFCLLALVVVITARGIEAEEENALVDLKNFQILRTPHFDIYVTTAQILPRAREAGRILEDAYHEFLDKLGLTRSEENKIAVFLYESRGNFQRSTVSSAFGKLSRQGFSEPLKNRIVLWLSPSQRENFYELRTNLAQMLLLQHMFPGNGPRLFLRYIYPEWMLAGIALYLAGVEDPLSQMALQDAIFSEQLRPLAQLKSDTHLQPHELREVYQYYLEVFRFLENRYGREKLPMLVRLLDKSPAVRVSDGLLDEVYGVDENGLHAAAVRQLKERWSPAVSAKNIGSNWQRLTEYERYYRHWDIAPAVAPDNRSLVFLSDRNDIFHLYHMNEDGTELTRVIQLGYGWTIDGLQGLETPPVYAPDGSAVLVQGVSGYRQCLFLVGLGTFTANRALDQLSFDDYAGACFAPDGKSIVFVGVRHGLAQLYRYHLDSGELTQLTHDGRAKFQPRFDRDGKKIVYIAEEGLERDIYILDVESGTTTRLPRPGSDEAYPQFTPDNRYIIFTSTQGPVINLCRCDPLGTVWEQLTDVPQGILTPALSPDGRWVYFSYYYRGRPQIYRVELASLQGSPLPSQPPLARPILTAGQAEQSWPVTAYETALSSDFIFPFLAFNALRFSDMAGLHSLQTQFGLFSGLIVDPGRGSSGRSQADFSLGVRGQLTYTFASFLSLTMFGNLDYVEKDEEDGGGHSWDYQAGGRISSNFALYARTSLTLGYTLFHRKQTIDHPDDISHHYWTGGVFANLEFDNINRRGLDPTGGYAGEFGYAIYDRIFGGDFDFKVFTASLRYYYSLYEDHILMFRLNASIAQGRVPFTYDLGGGSNLRGVSVDDLEGTERWVATIEYRFPLYRDANLPILGLLKDVRAFVFFDIGSVSTRVITRCSDWNKMDVVYAVGGGLRLDYYFLQHFALPVTFQVGKRLDENDKAIFYLGVSRHF